VSGADLAILAAILQAPAGPPARIVDFGAWKQAWQKIGSAWATPIDRALAGGQAADRPAWVFAAGYQAAIQQLLPDLPPATIAAVCISEEHGAHPAGIQTRLTAADEGSGWWLDGTKAFVSGAQGADRLLVAASAGTTPEGRNRLRMVMLPADRAGVRITPLPDLGFIPEMPHGRVAFEAVELADAALLPGDGYIRAVKPFRTLEDIHVTAAFLAWFFAVGRRSGWPDTLLETLPALMATARTLALAPPLAPHVHLALGGLLSQLSHVLDAAAPFWEQVDSRTRQCWRRDKRILEVADGLRAQRLEAARAHFRSP
jgi:acyl-CoA dehydrogenase